MPRTALLLAVILTVLLGACTLKLARTPTPTPGPDVQATIEAGVRATVQALPVGTPMPTLTAVPTTSPTAVPHGNLAQLRSHMLDLINQARVAHGLSPVALGDNAAAQRHAEDMFTHG